MKTAFITGASRGLGRHLSKYFWKNGYSLILVARNTDQLKALRSELPSQNNQTCDLRKCDLSNLSQVELLCTTLKREKFEVDVLINNAAAQGTIGNLSDVTSDELQRVLNVNLLAPVELCKISLPIMKKQRSGSIINISGGGGASARRNFYPYSVSKAALIRFTENLASELSNTEIKVNCVAPGIMNTAMMNEIVAAGIDKSGLAEIKAAQETIQAEEQNFDQVTTLIGFLTSYASDGITGKLISAKWDNWQAWPKFIDEVKDSDVYTLGRIVGQDRNFVEGDA